MSTKSPLAPASFPEMPPVAGLALASAASGMRYKGRDDVMIMFADEGSAFAGVFTTSRTASAAVHLSRAGLRSGRARAVLTNAGNANAFTGKRGNDAIAAYRGDFAAALGLDDEQILIASTGVIGEPLQADALIRARPKLIETLGRASWQACAEAIRTTDTFAKGATRQIELSGQRVTINGIAKGSGMIAPDMATMLAYIGTDAKIDPACLQEMVRRAADRSFNAITVDSDTSTSDSVYVIATQRAAHARITSLDGTEAGLFFSALEAVMTDLAQQIVKDGEGATKFITVTVSGAASDAEARTVAFAIGNSPLVKTAIAGEDANWGRIVMAVGKSGAQAERDRLRISVGGQLIAADGEAVDGYDERPVTQHMKGQMITIDVDLGLAAGSATIWTCDLTHGYITINGDYRS